MAKLMSLPDLAALCMVPQSITILFLFKFIGQADDFDRVLASAEVVRIEPLQGTWLADD